MFMIVFWMNRNLSYTWLMIGVEIIVGTIVYTVLVILLKAPIVKQVKELISNRLSKKN